MIVLKNLSQQYKLDPYKVRTILRAAGLQPPKGRWKWPDENDPHLQQCKQALTKATQSTAA
jgi:hypothetical protein